MDVDQIAWLITVSIALILLLILGSVVISQENEIRTKGAFVLIDQDSRYTCQIVQAESGYELGCLEGAK